jgi:hypothetical protein
MKDIACAGCVNNVSFESFHVEDFSSTRAMAPSEPNVAQKPGDMLLQIEKRLFPV